MVLSGVSGRLSSSGIGTTGELGGSGLQSGIVLSEVAELSVGWKNEGAAGVLQIILRDDPLGDSRVEIGKSKEWEVSTAGDMWNTVVGESKG
ncbi:hypothetical protein SARC_05518 [Sphaeroforma arctica JP610]|uniref:Uncharacterized protein n=1 Tax=Sphaeroforma arctica JP610 TaxID=667725 RepID=A0A0L0G1X7_9EUKA|nr:hypothetical protein SARC_05518 [Sphaeroforma arctica JP610]KNC82198.1 hypothetical protein SARC_05518 [Sphaeroforma arctica JP610]|eukprot:XP_014156100.1 hypothetical protein SARC_05518 [Sphaeroforma arctica JP610]